MKGGSHMHLPCVVVVEELLILVVFFSQHFDELHVLNCVLVQEFLRDNDLILLLSKLLVRVDNFDLNRFLSSKSFGDRLLHFI